MLAERNDWGDQKRAAMNGMFDSLVTVEIDHPAVEKHYVRIDVLSRKQGRTMGKNDLWVAACSAAAGAVLLTADKDFDHLFPGDISGQWVDPLSKPEPPTKGQLTLIE